MSRLPLIGVTECSTQIGLHAYHISGDTYVRAVPSAAADLTVILSSMTDRLSPSDILDGLDGTPITVTSFNIEPIHNSGLTIACDVARPAFRTVWKKRDSLSKTPVSTRRRCVNHCLTQASGRKLNA
jgi:hypothetical protein